MPVVFADENPKQHAFGRQVHFVAPSDYRLVKRPRAIPAKSARKPSPFCRKKLPAAVKYWAVRRNSPDSRMYVEKVVKAPMKPIITMTRASPETGHRFSKRAHTSPAAKHPVVFTAKVPHGKVLPATRWANPASAYRQRVPAAPARQSRRMRCVIVPLLCFSGLDYPVIF